MLTSLLVLLALVGLGVPAALYALQDRLLFFPQPVEGAQREAILRRHPGLREAWIETSTGRRHAWHLPGDGTQPLILYFGGNAEEVSWMIPEAMSRTPGQAWLLVDYPAYGASEGEPSQAAIEADALQWHDHATQVLRAGEVIVFGRSLGSGAAVYLASQRPVKAVILATPYDSLVAVAAHHYPFVPVRLLLRHPFDSLARAGGLRVPLLCIAAGRDEVIPPAHARRLFEAWTGPKRWVEIPNAGHNGTDGAPEFWKSITAFLQQ